MFHHLDWLRFVLPFLFGGFIQYFDPPAPGAGIIPAGGSGGANPPTPPSPAPAAPQEPPAPAPAGGAAPAAPENPWQPVAKDAYLAWLKAEGLSPESFTADQGPASHFAALMAQAKPEQRAAFPFVFKRELDARVKAALKAKNISPEQVAELQQAKAEVERLQKQLQGLSQRTPDANLPEGFQSWPAETKNSYLALKKENEETRAMVDQLTSKSKDAAYEEEVAAAIEEAKGIAPYVSPSLFGAVFATNKGLKPGEDPMDIAEAAMHAHAEQISMVEKALEAGDATYWELVMKSLPGAFKANVPQAARVMQLALQTSKEMQDAHLAGDEGALGGAGTAGGQAAGESYQDWLKRNTT